MLKDFKDLKISLADVIHNSLFFKRSQGWEQENLVAVFLLVVEDLATVPKDPSDWLSDIFDAGKNRKTWEMELYRRN